VKPSTVDIGDLADVLTALEKSLSRPDPEGPKKRNQRIPVSLTAIEAGSLMGAGQPAQRWAKPASWALPRSSPAWDRWPCV
jgi:hypothetical protein